MRECSGCGLRFCEGECFLEDAPETEGDPEMDAWLANCAREEAEQASRLNKGLAPRKAA